METRKLGKTDLELSVIGMGTWRTFDVPLSDEAAISTRAEVVSAAIECGTNHFDSSPMYGNAEDVLARALGDKRKDVMIETKVWSRHIGSGKEQIEHALQIYDGVDIYQVHNLVEWETYLPYLHSLKEQGSVRAIGVTHYAHSAFPEMMRVMEREPIDMVQIPYNATDRLAERELLPLADAVGLGVLVMSPLGSGDLVWRSLPPNEMEPLKDFGINTWAQALLKWVVADRRVTAVIPATSKVERARENAHAGDEPLLPEEQRERVAWLADRFVR